MARVHHAHYDSSGNRLPDTVTEEADNPFVAQQSGQTSNENLRLGDISNKPKPGEFDPQALYNDQYMGQQQTALDALEREVQYGGMTPEEKQSYQRQAAQSAGIAVGQRAGLAQQMISKGMPASIANQMAGEIGQQQESVAGYAGGTAEQAAANQRAYGAATQAAGLANNMQQQYLGEGEFNKAQGLRGVLERLGADTGQLANAQLRSDTQAANAAQSATEFGNAIVGGIGTAAQYDRDSHRGQGGRSGFGDSTTSNPWVTDRG